jgi:hypothetical protein
MHHPQSARKSNESVNADTKVVVLVRLYEEVKEQLALQGKCRVSRSGRRFQILKTHLSLVT